MHNRKAMKRLFAGMLLLAACSAPNRNTQSFDIIIRNGMVYDGTGQPPAHADVGIRGDTIAFIGDLRSAAASREIDAHHHAVAPGFINVLSWADQNLLKDGRSMSDIMQGVTLEVFGEGWSPGPKKEDKNKPADSTWSTLGGYFDLLARKGISPNVASFVGHTSVRNLVLGLDDRDPTEAELNAMRSHVAQAMEEGALGLGTSLIYPPASYAETEELIELSKVAAGYGGIYITHMRSEGDHIFKALNEVFTISREAGIPAEIYHLKINVSRNWNKIDTLLFRLDSARAAGLPITANMYPYVASGTGLTARLPDWVQAGGGREMRRRLRRPEVRRRVLHEMRNGIPYKNSDPRDVQLMHFRDDSLNHLYRGKRLHAVAQEHGKDPDETLIDLVIADRSRIESLYFLQSEENLRKILKQPYVSIGSDAGSVAITEGELDPTHPRTYGSFARVLARYVRDEKLLTLEEAVRRMTSLPTATLHIDRRGKIETGYFADLVIFDPDKIQDHATFEEPHQYATGVDHVLVNGILVLHEGRHTGAKPGRVVYGPGLKRM